MSPDKVNAYTFLANLRAGDPVVLTVDGQPREVLVQRALHRADPGGFGSSESARVTVGYGPGRWNVEVTVEALASGRFQLKCGVLL